ncbi:energy transducer TonB [Hymenobacter gummosus]|uniref:Energy transducer TonB n=1 Tax=Hymenobacter gummosus TaxID=1776032 RepID=A0A3S0JHM9_9BACT|nr:energy transducer TonB [Hymenobacter gummosus]RTQ53686.1 energy transducer TonB [Hymenobacter gummosus]
MPPLTPPPPRPFRRSDQVLLIVFGLALVLVLAGFFWWQASLPRAVPAAGPAAATPTRRSDQAAPRTDDSLAVAAETVYANVDQMPQPPGGMDGLTQYLSRNIKYPAAAQLQGVQGRIYVSFVVGPTGEIRNTHVSRGIGGGCDEEALRVIRQMPAWTPGRQDGRAVSVAYTVPVTFTLQ